MSIHKLTNILFTISKTPIVMLLKKIMKESIGNFWCSENNVHDQVTVFNQTLMNIFSNFITNKLITADDKKFYGPFLWMGFNCLKATEPLQRGSLLFTAKFPEIPGCHLIDLRKMKGWVHLGPAQWFWSQDLWIGNPAP